MVKFRIKLAAVLFLIGGIAASAWLHDAGIARAADKPGATDLYGDPLPRHALRRLGTIRFRQGSAVTGLRYLPDRKTLVSVGGDQVVRYWEAATGKELYRFEPPGGGSAAQQMGLSSAVVLSPDGRLAASSLPAQPVKVWDTATGKVLRQFGEAKQVSEGILIAAGFSPDSQTLAVVDQDNNEQSGKVLLWEVATGKEKAKLVGPLPRKEDQQRFMPQDFRFSPDGRIGAASGTQANNSVMCLWDLATQTLLPPLQGHVAANNGNPGVVIRGGGVVTGGGLMVFSPDGKLLVDTVGQRQNNAEVKIGLWEVATGRKVKELGELKNGATTVLFSPDGRLIAAQDGDQMSIHIWDAQTGKELPAFGAAANSTITDFVFAPDGKTLAVGATDDTVRLVDPVTGQELRELKGYQGLTNNVVIGDSLIGGLGESIAFAADGRTVAAAAGSLIRQWDVASGKEIRPVDAAAHEGVVLGLAVSRDGKWLATVSEDNTVRLWDAATGKQLRQLQGPAMENAVLVPDVFPVKGISLAFAPDARSLAVGWWDGTIDLYDPANGKKLRQLKGSHQLGITSLAFAPNGRALASGGQDGRALWWDVASGRQLRQYAGSLMPEGADQEMVPQPPVRVAVSPDGKLLAVSDVDDAGSYRIRLFELASGQLRRRLVFKEGTDAGAMPRLAGLGGLARAGIPGGPFGGLDGLIGIAAMSFTPDSKRLLWTEGNTTRLVDLARGKEVRRFGGQEGPVHAAVLSPDGKLLAGASEDGTVQLWDTATGTVLGQLAGHRGSVNSLAFAPNGQTLASTGADTTVLIWDVNGFLEAQRATARLSLSEQQLASLWNALATDDGEKAHDAVDQLVETPAQAVPVLRDRVKPVPPPSADRIARLIADLEGERFEDRKQAAEALEKLAELAEPALRKRLADNPPLEARQRIDQLLEKLAGPMTDVEHLRALRSLEVLEKIGTREARSVLETLAGGAPAARLTQDARAALQRLAGQR